MKKERKKNFYKSLEWFFESQVGLPWNLIGWHREFQKIIFDRPNNFVIGCVNYYEMKVIFSNSLLISFEVIASKMSD